MTLPTEPFVLVLALSFASVVSLVAPADAAPLVVGHRGAPRELPESTLAGFALAFEHADLIELDVRVSADGVLVVHHDATIPSRCAPHAGARVRALTFARLREVACTRDSAQRPLPGAQIPALDEVLALARGRGVLVEVKADDAPAPAVLAGLLAAALDASRARGVVVESFSPAHLEAMRARAPAVARGLLCADCAGALAEAARLAAVVVSPAHDAIDAAFVRDAHARGLAVVAWTANDAAAWSRLRALAVDAIVTDDPRALRASLGAR